MDFKSINRSYISNNKLVSVWFRRNHSISSSFRYEGKYINKTLQGSYKTFAKMQGFDNYWLLSDVNFKDARRHGMVRFYYYDGKILKEYLTEYNIKNGYYKKYYKNGNLEKSCNYDNGIKQGLFEEFYDDGKIKLKKNYINGEVEGLYVEYYANGNPEVEIYYMEGTKDKYIKKFDPDGKVIYYRHRDYGRLV